MLLRALGSGAAYICSTASDNWSVCEDDERERRRVEHQHATAIATMTTMQSTIPTTINGMNRPFLVTSVSATSVFVIKLTVALLLVTVVLDDDGDSDAGVSVNVIDESFLSFSVADTLAELVDDEIVVIVDDVAEVDVVDIVPVPVVVIVIVVIVVKVVVVVGSIDVVRVEATVALIGVGGGDVVVVTVVDIVVALTQRIKSAPLPPCCFIPVDGELSVRLTRKSSGVATTARSTNERPAGPPTSFVGVNPPPG
jgi:hypothetical protein